MQLQEQLFLNMALAQDSQEVTRSFARTIQKPAFTRPEVHKLRHECRRRICDDILIDYLNQQRLDGFPELRDLPLDELLSAAQKEIGLVYESLDALNGRELPDDHLASIVQIRSITVPMALQAELQAAHPEAHMASIQKVIPFPEVHSVFESLATHLREMRQKILRNMHQED